MKYKVILENKNYALILRNESLNEIAVVANLDKTNGIWGHTVDYMDYEEKNKAYALSIMLDLFRYKTEKEYISRCRLEELAIEEDSPIANTKFENPMYNKGYDDGFSDGANNADIESEVNKYDY